MVRVLVLVLWCAWLALMSGVAHAALYKGAFMVSHDEAMHKPVLQLAVRLPAIAQARPTLLIFPPSASVWRLQQELKLEKKDIPLFFDKDHRLLMMVSDTPLHVALKRATRIEIPSMNMVLHSERPSLVDKGPLTYAMVQDQEFIAKARAHHAAILEARRQAPPREYPFEDAEIMGNSLAGDLEWAYNFVTSHFGAVHPFPTYEGTGLTGLYALETGQPIAETGALQHIHTSYAAKKKNTTTTMNLAADWASGTLASDLVQQLMTAGAAPGGADYNIHIGDVYMVGTHDEVRANALGVPPPGVKKGVLWPHGQLGTFSLNGNHEMFSRGYGYFDEWLPTIGSNDPVTGKVRGQVASYFSLENEYWRVIALDTGYHTYKELGITNKNNTQPPSVMQWLTDVVKLSDPTDTRGLVFLSHHQYLSAFDEPFPATPTQIAALVPANRTVVWLFGHEHRVSWYNKTNWDDLPLQAYARCIGVGGFPVTLGPIPARAAATKLLVYDDRPSAVIHGFKNQSIGYNGFSRVTFNGPSLEVTYESLQTGSSGGLSHTNTTLLVKETFTADQTTGSVRLIEFDIVDPQLTIVRHLEEE